MPFSNGLVSAMKCPVCANNMESGQVTVPDLHPIADLAKYLDGPQGRHCLFTSLNEETREKHVVVPNNSPRPAFRCPECEIAVIWGPNWTTCPNCSTPINPTTGVGLTSTKDEPWFTFCEQCQTEIKPDI